jgi:hypothetical protein
MTLLRPDIMEMRVHGRYVGAGFPAISLYQGDGGILAVLEPNPKPEVM